MVPISRFPYKHYLCTLQDSVAGSTYYNQRNQLRSPAIDNTYRNRNIWISYNGKLSVQSGLEDRRISYPC